MVIIIVIVGIRGTIKDFWMTYIYFAIYTINIIIDSYIRKSIYRSIGARLN